MVDALKRYWPIIIGTIIAAFMYVALLGAQDKGDAVTVTEPSFPINYSCGATAILDNDGNQNGWLLVLDVTSRSDDVNAVTKHIQMMFRMGDEEKMDAACLKMHKEFNTERANERKRLKSAQPKRKEPIPAFKPKKIDLQTAEIRRD